MACFGEGLDDSLPSNPKSDDSSQQAETVLEKPSGHPGPKLHQIAATLFSGIHPTYIYPANRRKFSSPSWPESALNATGATAELTHFNLGEKQTVES